MYCTKCGKELKRSHLQYCPYCGAENKKLLRQTKTPQSSSESNDTKIIGYAVMGSVAFCVFLFLLASFLENNESKLNDSYAYEEQNYFEDYEGTDFLSEDESEQGEDIWRDDDAWQSEDDTWQNDSGIEQEDYDDWEDEAESTEEAEDVWQDEEDDGSLYQVRVIASDGFVNFRDGAGKEYDIITEIYNGEVLSVFDENETGKWLYVEYQGVGGWIAASEVERIE